MTMPRSTAVRALLPPMTSLCSPPAPLAAKTRGERKRTSSASCSTLRRTDSSQVTSAKATTCRSCLRRYPCHWQLNSLRRSEPSSDPRVRCNKEGMSITSSRSSCAIELTARRANRAPSLKAWNRGDSSPRPSHARAASAPSLGKRSASADAAASPRASSPMMSQRARIARAPPRRSCHASNTRPAAERTNCDLSERPATKRTRAAEPKSSIALG
mmetsp:Transcript_86330/g.252622  ORF Transcript_86330/g.252622 Transcript_86330/m.252622 type:complete len:215 (+) Transcript_86330:2582-3226(+)